MVATTATTATTAAATAAAAAAGLHEWWLPDSDRQLAESRRWDCRNDADWIYVAGTDSRRMTRRAAAQWRQTTAGSDEILCEGV